MIDESNQWGNMIIKWATNLQHKDRKFGVFNNIYGNIKLQTERDLSKTPQCYIKERERPKRDVLKEIQMTRGRAVRTQMSGFK